MTDPLERALVPRELRPFLDTAGRLRQWPSRYKVQRMAAEAIARELGAPSPGG